MVVRVGDVGASDRAHVRALAERRVDDVELGDARGADEERARAAVPSGRGTTSSHARALGLAKERGGGRGRGVGDPTLERAILRRGEDDDARAEVRGALRVRGGPRTRRRVEVHDAGGAVGTRARRVGGQTRRVNIRVRARALAKMTFRQIRARAAQRWPRAAATARLNLPRPSSLRTFRDRVVQPFTRVDPRARPTRRALRVVRFRALATTHTSYYERVRRELNLALCVQNFPCQNVERHNKPEVEFQDSPELVLPPVEVARNDNERVLIERSINSARVSVKVKQADELEEILCRQFMRFLTQRAEAFKVLRRVPVPGYDVSFLVTHEHVEDMRKPKLVDFIVRLLEDVDREMSEQKLSVSSRGRVVAADFLKSFV